MSKRLLRLWHSIVGHEDEIRGPYFPYLRCKTCGRIKDLYRCAPRSRKAGMVMTDRALTERDQLRGLLAEAAKRMNQTCHPLDLETDQLIARIRAALNGGGAG